MPGYAGDGQATLLGNNAQAFFFQNETNLQGVASVAFQMERVNPSFYPWGASFQVYFTDASGNAADPGAFEIDIQHSDIDEDMQYVTAQTLTDGLNAHFVGRVAAPIFYAKFIRGFVKTVTNPVYLTLMATR